MSKFSEGICQWGDTGCESKVKVYLAEINGQNKWLCKSCISRRRLITKYSKVKNLF